MPEIFTVHVRYRTNSGCNTKTIRVFANSMDNAIDLASAKVRRQRGVIRIDGGHVYSNADNRESLWKDS